MRFKKIKICAFILFFVFFATFSSAEKVNISFSDLIFINKRPFFKIKILDEIQNRNINIFYKIQNHEGVILEEKNFSINLAGKSHIEILPQILNRSGYFEIEIKIFDSKGMQIVSDFLPFALLKIYPSNGTDSFYAVGDYWGLAGTGIDFLPSVGSFLSQVGLSRIRLFVGWHEIQSMRRGALDWSWLDEVFRVANKSGLAILPVIGFTPDFAALEHSDFVKKDKKSYAIPPYLDDFIYFTESVVQRYRGMVDEWEIWNEPNAKSFWLGDIVYYVSLLKEAHKIINANDPGALVVSGGTSGVPRSWLNKLSLSGACNYFDVLAIHPYRYPRGGPEKPIEQFSSSYGGHSLSSDLAWAGNVCSNKSLWVTEAGYNTFNGKRGQINENVSLLMQASYLVRTHVLAKAAGVERFYWWRFSDTDGAGMGLIRNRKNHFAPKPSLVAYIVLKNMMNANSIARIEVGDDSSYVYGIGPKPFTKYVAWSIDGDRELVLLESGSFRLIDMMGQERSALIKKNGSVQIGEFPVYLVVDNPQ